jgi:hypothetical protein
LGSREVALLPKRKAPKARKSIAEMLVWFGRPRNNLRTTPRGLLGAAVIVGALLIILAVAYSVFDLGAILPKQRWQR